MVWQVLPPPRAALARRTSAPTADTSPPAPRRATAITRWTNRSSSGNLLAADAQFVFDIDTDPSQVAPLKTSPPVQIESWLYFAGGYPTSGNELWRVNVASSSAELVFKIQPGTVGGFQSPPFSGGRTANLTNVNGLLYFVANDGVHGYELWRSDGTSSGTWLVHDIQPGANESYPDELINANGRQYFSANDGVHGFELWTSDGTSSGTTMLQDAASGAANSNPKYLTNHAGTLFYRVGGNVQTGLSKSDGTSSGTVLVRGFNNSSATLPRQLTSVGSHLYFTANGVFVGSAVLCGPSYRPTAWSAEYCSTLRGWIAS